MLEKERVDFSLPDGMDPDTLISIPLHCISDIFAWMAYTRVIHPQSAFAKDIETIRQAVWDVNKGNETSTDIDIKEGDGLVAIDPKASFTVVDGDETCLYPASKGDILVIEKIKTDEGSRDPVVTVHFKRYLKRIDVKKSYLAVLVKDRQFAIIGPPGAVEILGG